MTLRVRIGARAVREIERADAWWRENRLGAPTALRDDLNTALALLAKQPGIGLRVANARTPDVRRVHLGRVRYFVYYRVRNETLTVLSVRHSSRDPDPKV